MLGTALSGPAAAWVLTWQSQGGAADRAPAPITGWRPLHHERGQGGGRGSAQPWAGGGHSATSTGHHTAPGAVAPGMEGGDVSHMVAVAGGLPAVEQQLQHGVMTGPVGAPPQPPLKKRRRSRGGDSKQVRCMPLSVLPLPEILGAACAVRCTPLSQHICTTSRPCPYTSFDMAPALAGCNDCAGCTDPDAQAKS